ncbi:hypothetical protein PC9H_001839 [Pleurotus ostreatus]|uniref:Uncharacterized protein n=1 Tax=Pleurotus ostreatus TaxID=5322 RepID=A0A8H6ZKH7_PLEOS|nr:uncharacterized protein PC9H_001839 [Pleurotus ostreatus]KAF7419252.1 hypothetical protein PC9H_001839 [Pleurotus ostreatus]
MSSSSNTSAPVNVPTTSWGRELEEALAQQPDIIIPPISFFLPAFRPLDSTPTVEVPGAIPSLIGDVLTDIFQHTNEIVITALTPFLLAGHPGIIFLDGVPSPALKEALGRGCRLERKTLAFCTEIRIFHPRSAITVIDVEDILDPFEGQLLASPTNSLLSLDSIVFEPRHYGFGAVVGFHSQTSDGHFIRVIIRFNRRLYDEGLQVEHKVFVSFWFHKDHVALLSEDRRLLDEDSALLDQPEIIVAPSSMRYKVHIFD